MSKSHFSFVLGLLLFSVITLQVTQAADDLVALKNLSWEEQKNGTRIILETTQPLQYNVTASQTAAEVQMEIANLDLRNLPQELFINTNEVVSLQTFPQTDKQKSRIVIKLTSFLPHQVSTEGNKLYVDISGNRGSAASAASPATETPATPATKEQEPPAVTEAPQPSTPSEAAPPEKTAEAVEEAPAQPAVPAEQETPSPAVAATEIHDVQINPAGENSADVILMGNGSFQYNVFELSNPERLVIDVKSVTIASSVRNTVQSAQGLFSKVRIAQYQVSPKVVRAVIDLNKKVPYTVIPEGKQLRIHLGETDVTPQADSNGNASQVEPEAVSTSAQPAAPKAEDPKPEVTKMVSKMEAPKSASLSNEQFFSFQPDTSLFAQEGGRERERRQTEPRTQQTEPTSTGMGTFQETTVKGGQKQYTGEPFSFDFKDIDIKDLFRFIADISGLNVILDPSVKGSVTLKLTEVPWDQALDLITKNQGLGYTIEGNVIRIAPLETIAREEKARADAQKQAELSAPLVTKIKPLSYAKADAVAGVIKKLLTPKGSTITDPRTNTLIITDIDTNIDAVTNLVDILDSRTAQVIIEARIVETTKNYAQAFGIQWGFRGIVDPAFGNNTTLQFPNNLLVSGDNLSSQQAGIFGNPLGGYAVNLPTNSAPNSAVLLSAGNILDTFRLDVALMALESAGHGRILSSPKVATQNNTSAEILQGTRIPVQTVANNTITTTFVDAALRMSVQPQITAEGTIIMTVSVENSRPDFANVVFGTPPIITERATTTLLVEDGGTTVIGGIFTASDQYAQGRTPILHRIPLLGWLFKNTNITRENRELLIFLTPRILR